MERCDDFKECPARDLSDALNAQLTVHNEAAIHRHEELVRKLQRIEDGNSHRDQKIGELEDAMYGNGKPGLKQELLELRIRQEVLSTVRNKWGGWIVPAVVGGAFTIIGYGLLAGVQYALSKL